MELKQQYETLHNLGTKNKPAEHSQRISSKPTHTKQIEGVNIREIQSVMYIMKLCSNIQIRNQQWQVHAS